MDISNELISQFVKITNDTVKKKESESIVYGTVVTTEDGNFVKIDGSELLTPVETTADILDGERVTVMIKNHSATVTGNITSPSASSSSVANIGEQIEKVEGDVISIGHETSTLATKDALAEVVETLNDDYLTELEVYNAIDDDIQAAMFTIDNTYATKQSVNNLSDGISKDYVSNDALSKAIEDAVIAIEGDVETIYATKNDVSNLDKKLTDDYSTTETIETTFVKNEVLDDYVTKSNLDEKLTADYSTTETIEATFVKNEVLDAYVSKDSYLNEDLTINQNEPVDIPRDLNGYTVTIEMDALVEEGIRLEGFINGTMIFKLNEQTIKGPILCSGSTMRYVFQGPGNVGSLTFMDCEFEVNDVTIEDAERIGVTTFNATGDLYSVAFGECIGAITAEQRSHLYLDGTSGTFTGVVITALNGSIISVNEEGSHFTTTGETEIDIRKGSLIIPSDYSFKPVVPEDPEDPDNPVTPEDPENPEDPEDPENPEDPVTPEE